MEIGSRVIAIRNASSDEVFYYGEGQYIGDKVPPVNVCALFHSMNVPNPCIKLDSGEEVYGMECYWGAEDRVKARYAGVKFTLVPVERKKEA